jgi:hypothetical protein
MTIMIKDLQMSTALVPRHNSKKREREREREREFNREDASFLLSAPLS